MLKIYIKLSYVYMHHSSKFFLFLIVFFVIHDVVAHVHTNMP